MMASYVPSAASWTNLMPSVMCTFTRGSSKPSAICGKYFFDVAGTILQTLMLSSMQKGNLTPERFGKD